MDKNKKIAILVIVVVILLLGIGHMLGLWGGGFRESQPHFPASDNLMSGDPFAIPTSKFEKEVNDSKERLERTSEMLAENEKYKIDSPFKVKVDDGTSDAPVASGAKGEDEPKEAKPTLEERVRDLSKLNEKEEEFKGDEFEKNYREILASDKITEEQVVKFLYKDLAEKKLAEGANYETMIDELLRRVNSIDKYEAQASGIVLGKFLEMGEAEMVALALQRGGLTQLGKEIVVEALGRLGDSRTFKILYDELVRTTEYELRDRIIEAIGSLNDKRAVSVFFNIIDNKNPQNNSPYTRFYAIAGLARIKKDEAKRMLETEFNTFVGRSYARHFQAAREYAAGDFDPKRTDISIEQGIKKQELYYKGTRYLLYVPTRAKTDQRKTRVLVCVPGLDYAYQELHEMCTAMAQKYSMAALTVFFDITTFPRYWSLNLSTPRSDHRLMEILKHLNKYANLDTREIYLFGDYEGGEFVQAISLFYPSMIGRAMFISNKLVKLNPNKMFPEGIGAVPQDLDLSADVVEFLKTDVAFLKPVMFRNKQVLESLEEYKKIYEDLGITPRFLVRNYAETPGQGSTIIYTEKFKEAVEQYLFQGH